MSMPRFAANLSFLWTELPFLGRFAAAKAAGFHRVEYMFPYPYPPGELRSQLDDAGLEQVLFNLPAGDWSAGDRGLAADPSRVAEFRAGVDQALAYAEALGVAQLNCLAGLQLDGVEPARQWSTLVENVRYAGQRVGAEGRRLLVEPVNSHDIPGFLLPTTGDVLRLLEEVGDEGILLQFDAYHVHRMKGDPVAELEALCERVGHVQIADDPGRHQPGTGEIDFPALFALLDGGGYDGTVGLEYVPTSDTTVSLSWLDRFGFTLTQRS
jgi:hydroxypyruvate isomerase